MKLEKGCLAIVVDCADLNLNGSNLYQVVRVGSFIGKHRLFYGVSDLWEVDKPMIDSLGDIHYLQREKNLQRIDEPPDQIESTTEQKQEDKCGV